MPSEHRSIPNPDNAKIIIGALHRDVAARDHASRHLDVSGLADQAIKAGYGSLIRYPRGRCPKAAIGIECKDEVAYSGGDDMGSGEGDMNRDGTSKRVAADAADLQAANSALASLARSVDTLKKKMDTPLGDPDAFYAEQAKADSVMSALGSRAEKSLPGEDLISYRIRLARKMQHHSAKWKGADLRIIAADRVAFENVLSEIRSDAMAASMSSEGMQPLTFREITKTTPGGHTIREFIGPSTFIRQMSRPVRFVSGFRQPTPN